MNARALYTDSNLADLYDPLTMPTELLKAHKANNRAVMHAYGFSIKMSEADCVAELMRMYQKLTKEKMITPKGINHKWLVPIFLLFFKII